MNARHVATITLIAGLVAASCTSADQANPPGSDTTGTTGTTRRTATTKGPTKTIVAPTYPPVSGPELIGTASTVPPTDAELKIPELNDAPTLIDLPCHLEHQTDGYTEALAGLTAQPPTDTNIDIGQRLTYHDKPAVLTRGEHGYIYASHLDQAWIVATRGRDSRVEYILAEVDPTTAQIKGDTYRLTGCRIENISRSPDGDTWIAVCQQEGSRFKGTAVRLDPAGVMFNQIAGLHTICPEVIATPDYTWLVSKKDHDSRSKRQRLWRLDPDNGQWHTIDFPDTNGYPGMGYTDGVLWEWHGDRSFCVTQEPPESHGPTGITAENLNLGPSQNGGIRNGQMWTTAEHHRLVAFDCDGNKVADFALNDPSSVSVGEPGIIVQRPSRRDQPNLIPVGADITISRLDPSTGQTTDLITAPALTVPRGPNGSAGSPYGIIFDRTGGWLNADSPVRIPDSWFKP